MAAGRRGAVSLGVVIKGTEGVVLAADSRATLLAHGPGGVLPVHFDNATKLLTFHEPHNWVGAVTYGAAVMGTQANDLRTAHSFVPEFEASLPEERLAVGEFADRLSQFYLTRWDERMPPNFQGGGMTFVIGGFNEDSPYGSVYFLEIPGHPQPEERSINEFGITWGGQVEYASRIIQGYDLELPQIAKATLGLSDQQVGALKAALQPLGFTAPYNILPLQDCVDLAIFLVKTTITAQRLSIGIRGVGGSIDVAVITRREGLRVIQQKELVAERSTLD
jgi:hypothetical protein